MLALPLTAMFNALNGRRRATWLGAALLASLWPSSAHAGSPSEAELLDALAAERGIEAGALQIGARVDVVAGTPSRGSQGERRELELHGLPLRGSFETLWREGDGSERIVAARYPVADARLRPHEARVSLDEARARLEPLLREDQRARLGPRALDGQLVYLLVLGQPLLAWEFTTPLSLAPEPSRSRVWISAAGGAVLEVEDLVHAINQAQVYDLNPVRTPTPITVTLSNIEPAPEPWAEGVLVEPGFLTGTRTRVFNCIDEPDGPFAPWRQDEECYPTQRARADASGDYFVPLPNVSLSADNKDPQDLYAELAMYWHAEKFFTRLAGLGVQEFPCPRANMVANFHRLIPTASASYSAYSNAYYTGVCAVEDGPTMLFGQGSDVDFAYDGDVVYHELGHGVIEQLTPAGLTSYAYRSDGTLNDARAISESIADYHSVMLSGDPELAEYIAFYTPSQPHPWFRNAANEARCPDDLNGEEHTDGLALTAALWAARTRVGGAKLDGVVLASLPLLARDATLEQAAAALLEVAAAEREAGTWTATDYDLLERSLAARNLLDCERVVDQPTRFTEPHKLLLRANNEFVAPFWPGPLQYRHVVPEGSDNLIVNFEVSSFGGSWASGELEPQLLVKRGSLSGEDPIAFGFELVPGPGEGEQLWAVDGDWDASYASTHLTDIRREVLVRGLDPGEVVHVSFVTADPEPTVLRELWFASVPAADLDGGSPNDHPEPDRPELEDDGCNCASPASDLRAGTGAGAAWLGLSLLGWRRRRRRSSGPTAGVS